MRLLLLPLCALFASQEGTKPPPQNAHVASMLEEVTAWPEYERASVNVAKFDMKKDQASVRRPLSPRRYGADVIHPAFRRTRDIVTAILPEQAAPRRG